MVKLKPMLSYAKVARKAQLAAYQFYGPPVPTNELDVSLKPWCVRFVQRAFFFVATPLLTGLLPPSRKITPCEKSHSSVYSCCPSQKQQDGFEIFRKCSLLHFLHILWIIFAGVVALVGIDNH